MGKSHKEYSLIIQVFEESVKKNAFKKTICTIKKSEYTKEIFKLLGVFFSQKISCHDKTSALQNYHY